MYIANKRDIYDGVADALFTLSFRYCRQEGINATDEEIAYTLSSYIVGKREEESTLGSFQ
ncbi:MAG: hypothetical protein ACRCZZ_05815 [Phocaeicola sp.]